MLWLAAWDLSGVRIQTQYSSLCLTLSLSLSLSRAVDAAYEGMGKRTFLAMGLSLLCYIVILIGVLLVYPKLAPPTSPQSPIEESDSDTSDSECQNLRPIDSFSDSDFIP